MKTVVYLHGFMSSSKSVKACLVQQWFSLHLPQQPLWVPDLPFSPRRAIEFVLDEIASQPAVFIGSSLGGFYANYLSERFASRSVMINPAVYPHELLKDFIGLQESPYTGEQFELTREHTLELKELYIKQMRLPALRRVLLQSGDETLDYRQAEQYYQASSLLVEEGGDHSFVNFGKHLPAITRFLLD